MDYQQIDILEDKINMAIELISRLRKENRQLEQQNSELLERAEKSETALKMLQEEFQHLTAIQNETESYQKREKVIKDKVEAMLSKLDSIQFSV